MSKRIVLCFDGTENQLGESNTNIAKLYQLLEQEKADEQIIFYDPGIGSKSFAQKHAGLFSRWFHTIKELYFGYGLQAHIEGGLRFLIEHYVPGDKVFLFGFARGAFTARSLAGMLERTGLLKKELTHLINAQTKIYNKCGYESSNQPKGQLRAQEFKQTFGRECPVHFIGVWDTVSALYGLASKRFHDCTLSEEIPYGYHALALNEDRVLFASEKWNFPNEVTENKKQIWFAGCHSDVGGKHPESGLGDITLQWMLDYARSPGGEDNNAIGVLIKNDKDNKDDKKDNTGVLVKKDYESVYNIKPDPLAKLHSEDNKWLKNARLTAARLAGAIGGGAIIAVAILTTIFGLLTLETAILEEVRLEGAILAITILAVTILAVVLGTTLGAILAAAISGIAILEAAILEAAISRIAILKAVRSRKLILAIAILVVILEIVILIAIGETIGGVIGKLILVAILLVTILGIAILGAKMLGTTRSIGAMEGVMTVAIGVTIFLTISIGAMLETLGESIMFILIMGGPILLVAISGIIILATKILAAKILAAKRLGTTIAKFAILVVAIFLAIFLAIPIGVILEKGGVEISLAIILGIVILAAKMSGTTVAKFAILAGMTVAIIFAASLIGAISELGEGGAVLLVIIAVILAVAILATVLFATTIALLFIGLRVRRKIVASNPEAKPLIHESVQMRMDADKDYEKQMDALFAANDLQLSDIEFVKK